MTYTRESLDLFHLSDPQREYRNLEDLYYREIDPVTELIQNAVLSIVLLQGEGPFRGSIGVTIDADRGELVVSDNGGGFETLEDIAANRSRRSIAGETPEAGFGLGLSSVLARSDYFSVSSINHRGQRHFAEWVDVRTKLHGQQRLQSLPADAVDGPNETRDSRRTTITVRGDGFADLWALARERPSRLFEMIWAHTAIGHTTWIWRTDRRPNVRYQATIRTGGQSEVRQGQIGFPVVRPSGRQLVNIEDYVRNGKHAGLDTLLIFTKEGRTGPVRRHSYNLYVACEIERQKHIKQRFGDYLEDLKTNRILLSVNGYLQSFPLERPAERQTRALWGNIVAVVDASVNIVEPGRNRVSDKYLHEIEDELKSAIARLDQAARAIRTAAETETEIDIEDAKNQVQAAVTARPLQYATGHPLFLLKEPEQEAEVVALFAHLVGQGLIDKTKLLAVGGSRWVYDAYLKYEYTYQDIGEARRPRRQEGGRRIDMNRARERILVSEFKLQAGSLAEELAAGKTVKRLGQVDLLVCWEEGRLPRDFILDVMAPENKFYKHATHRLVHQTGTRDDCEVLMLSSFLEELEAGAGA